LTKSTSRRTSSKWSSFSRMPSFGQAFAGVPPSPLNTSTTKSRDTDTKILTTLPSPRTGGLNDDLILQMVGAKPARKQNTQLIELEGLGYVSNKESMIN
jgi:hypothetical protein